MQSLIERQSAERTVTWTASTNSNELDVRGLAGLAIYLDASFTGSQLTFLGKVADATYKEIQDGGSAVTVTVTADKINVLPAELFGAFQQGKRVSDATETCTGKLLGAS